MLRSIRRRMRAAIAWLAGRVLSPRLREHTCFRTSRPPAINDADISGRCAIRVKSRSGKAKRRRPKLFYSRHWSAKDRRLALRFTNIDETPPPPGLNVAGDPCRLTWWVGARGLLRELEVNNQRGVIRDAAFDALVQSLQGAAEARREEGGLPTVFAVGQACGFDEDPVELERDVYFPLQLEGRDEALRRALVRVGELLLAPAHRVRLRP